ncbi:hypothetical protein PIB30_061199, partial [Stylosanthes scabra]|nr:hypothetical protein [Stylosanthes scabra]
KEKRKRLSLVLCLQKTRSIRKKRGQKFIAIRKVVGKLTNHPERIKQIASQAWSKAFQAPEWGQCYGPAPKAQSLDNKAINE